MAACASSPQAGEIRVGVVFLAVVVFGISSLNIILLWLVPYGWVLELALLFWTLFVDKVAYNGKGRPVVWFRRGWWFEHVRTYFPLTLRQEEPFDSSKRYLFVIHPHGIIGISAIFSFAADSVGLSRKNHDLDIALATVGINFCIPFWRDIILAVGFLDASFQSLSAALRRNRSVGVVLGGAAEALDAHPGTNDIIFHKRKGVFRLALTTGTPLVPVFSFGENDLFYQVPNPKLSALRKVQEFFMSIFKFSPPLIMGRGLWGCPFGPLPAARPILVVTGTPLPVPHIEKPTDEDIAKVQTQYLEALQKLYTDNAKKYYEEMLPEELRWTKIPTLRLVA